MPWNEVQVSEERLRFAIEASKSERSIAAICREFGITRKTGYLWLQRYQEGGAAAVINERSRRPHHSPQQTSQTVVTALKAARRQRPDWGARKLGRVIAQSHPQLPRVSVSTLQRILDREGLIQDEDRPHRALQRFERSQPNELWQMDFKGPQGFNRGVGPLSILDDHSRFLLALRQVLTNNTANVKAVLQETFIQYGLPEYLLLLDGKPWYDSINVWGWTELTVWILRQGVRISFSGIRHPQTQGKVERMHGALQRAIRKRKPASPSQRWLDEFRQEYNQLRPHEGIGMAAPITRWQPSPRQFNPKPSEWEYPSPWERQRLGGRGELRYQGRRWEISQALRNQLVGLQVNGPRVLVHYCNMAVREINLKTGKAVMLPGNPFRLLPC